jgi:hypothetical protein
MKILTNDNFGYVPVFKNGSTTFTNFFSSKGWKYQDLDSCPEDMILFGHIQDPHIRHTKGAIEFFRKFKVDIKTAENCMLLVAIGMFDVHSYPISILYPNHYRKIHWIPMGKDKFSCNKLTNVFFHRNGIDLKVPEDYVLHRSPKWILDAQERINLVKVEHADRYQEMVYYFMMEDLRLYFEAMERY